MSSVKPIIYKVVFMGDSGVGKSSIAERLVNDVFSISTEATIGASYLSKILSKINKIYNFNIWDTAGQEKYHCLVPLYYKNCDAAMIVYDITNRNSYLAAKKRIPELRKNSNVSAIILIGNKTDLIDRQVPKSEAQLFSSENNVLFLETSAKTAFHTKDILEKILEELPPPPAPIDSIPLIPTHTTYSCCNY